MALGGGLSMQMPEAPYGPCLRFVFSVFCNCTAHRENNIKFLRAPKYVLLPVATDNEIYLNCYGQVPKKLKMYL